MTDPLAALAADFERRADEYYWKHFRAWERGQKHKKKCAFTASKAWRDAARIARGGA